MTVPSRRTALLLIAGLLLVSLNLRAALTSIGPLIDDLRGGDLALSGAAIGLLTTGPLLALGLVSPLAPRLAERFGSERVVLGCLLAIGVGTAIRWLPTVTPLFAGTLLAGCAIAVGNVLVPGIVKHRYGGRAAFVTAVYSVGLSAGAALAAGLTVPVKELAGGNWRFALAFWALPALIGAVVWLPQLRSHGVRPARGGAPSARRSRAATASVAAQPPPPASAARISLWRDRRAWAISVFGGSQSLLYYAAAAWLPDILQEQGHSAAAAGGFLSLLMVLGIPAGFIVAAAASRWTDQRLLAIFGVVAPSAGWLGILLAPGSSPLPWVILLGLGAGVGFSLALTLYVLRARDSRHAAALSAMAQGAGYTLAALGPLMVGALHDLAGGWEVPLAALVLLGAPQLVAALVAAKPGFVGADRAEVGADTPPRAEGAAA